VWCELYYLPSPSQAVCHLKAAAFDDDLVMTGANLSHDYFTDRQDRYIIFKVSGTTIIRVGEPLAF